MPTSSEQIADLIAAYTDLKQFYEGARGQIETEAIAAIAAARNGLSAGIYVDAAAGVDDPASGGAASPLRSVRAALDRAIPGGTNRIFLRRGQSHFYSDAAGSPRTGSSERQVVIGATTLSFEAYDVGDDPTLTIGSYQDPGGVNHLAGWLDVIHRMDVGFRNIKLVLPPLPNPAGAIDWQNQFLFWPVGSMRGAFLSINFQSCDVTVHLGSFALTPASAMCALLLSFSNTSLRGGGVLIPGAEPTGVVAVRASTIVGGTRVFDGGVIGQGLISSNPTFVL